MDAAGDLYIPDEVNNTVQKWTPVATTESGTNPKPARIYVEAQRRDKDQTLFVIQWLVSAAVLLAFVRIAFDWSWGQGIVVAGVGSFTAIAAATASSRRRAAGRGTESRG
jgi:hypothetical protein